MQRCASQIRYLLARGCKFEQIAAAAGIPLMRVYRAYLGRADEPAVCRAYRFYAQSGRLPAAGELP